MILNFMKVMECFEKKEIFKNRFTTSVEWVNFGIIILLEVILQMSTGSLLVFW